MVAWGQSPLPDKRDFKWGSGLILKLLGLVVSLLLFANVLGVLVVVIVAAAAVLPYKMQSDRWVAPRLAVRTLFDCCSWTCRVTQPVQRTPLWPASWLPADDKNRGPSQLRFRGSEGV